MRHFAQRGRRISADGRFRPYFIVNDVMFVLFAAAAFIIVRAAAFIFGDVIVHFAARGVLQRTRGRVWLNVSARLKQLVLKVRFP